jgi:hypothetical protein
MPIIAFSALFALARIDRITRKAQFITAIKTLKHQRADKTQMAELQAQLKEIEAKIAMDYACAQSVRMGRAKKRRSPKPEFRRQPQIDMNSWSADQSSSLTGVDAVPGSSDPAGRSASTRQSEKTHAPWFFVRQLYFGLYPRIFLAFSMASRVSCGPKDLL